MMRIASEATGRKLESLHDCVKWARGLQKEFTQLYTKVEDKLQNLMAAQKQPQVNFHGLSSENRNIGSSAATQEDDYLSPIE